MVREKQQLIDHIRNTPFEQLETELKQLGMDTYKNTPNVIDRYGWTKQEMDEMLEVVKLDLKHQVPERRELNNKNIKRDLFYHVIREMASQDRFLHTEHETDGTNRKGLYIKGYVRDIWDYLEDAYDLIHDQDFESTKYFRPEYRKSGKFDDNGIEIIEGSIIRADGYGSDIEDRRFYCVEYDEDKAMFTSIIYGDEDPLSMYREIEVIGHCEDFRELYESDDWNGSGNLGAVLK